MPDDVATSPSGAARPTAPTAPVRPTHPVRQAVLVAAAALVVLVWSATLEVVCASAGGGPDGSFVMTPPCPAQINRTGAAVVAAVVVLGALALLLTARRRPWARRPGTERALFVAFVLVTALAVVAAIFSTGFAPAI
ncbi:hypothetical protein [Oerskovia sp. KBS0722]|uniref:hypothetical protein n=1 Tax=Oerskovia sp. KBS0722 TaxID=1179673 RepID=UPI00110D4647|nr:hypothetical protein [Oerskovia sp. KBS0722]QDW62390.1 hypothetical protein FFI11_007425 [Oerskovia sp. KBS0722]